MGKHSARDSTNIRKAPLFADFWQLIASELGSSRLKINSTAQSISTFIDSSGDQKDYLRDVIKQSYKRSQCYHLRDAIDLEAVLDILGETAYALQGQHADDLMDIELLEEIAWLIGERFWVNVQPPKTPVAPKAARVVNLSDSKIRRANAKL
jgi:hypothetical protein